MFEEQTRFPLGDNIGYIRLVHKHEDVGLSVVNAARISYNQQSQEFSEADGNLCKFLAEHQHTSPFRHQHYTFELCLPLSITRQWTKYQVGSMWRSFEIDQEEVEGAIFEEYYSTDSGCSWNELSGRYSKLEPEFYIPQVFRSNPPHGNKQVSEDNDWTAEQQFQQRERCYQRSKTQYDQYLEDLDRGVSKEQARMFLPQNIYTKVAWTVSLQALIHFLSQRLAVTAQWEIRQYALAMKELIAGDLSDLQINL